MTRPTLLSKLTPQRMGWTALLLAMLAAGFWWGTRAPQVDSVKVQSTTLVRTVQFSARVATLARVDVGSTLTARVAQVLVREGAVFSFPSSR